VFRANFITAIETCKTDDDGKAIHEDCYVKKLKLEFAPD